MSHRSKLLLVAIAYLAFVGSFLLAASTAVFLLHEASVRWSGRVDACDGIEEHIESPHRA